MKTWEAVKAMQDGYSVRRSWWAKDDYIKLNSSGDIVDRGGDLQELCDVSGNWEVYEEPGRGFLWAMEQVRCGKTVKRKSWSASCNTLSVGMGVVLMREAIDANDWILA